MNRREALGVGGLALTGALAGCISTILGDETAFEASPVTVAADVLQANGYQHVETHEIEESREFAGHNVRVTNWATEYERTLGVAGLEADTAAFAVISSPEVSVAGRDFNPLADMDTFEIAEMVQDEYDDVDIGEQEDEREVDALGETTTVDTFEGTATVNGTSLDVFFDIGRLTVGGDHIVVTGVYPDNPVGDLGYSPSDERARITALTEALEHDVEDDAEEDADDDVDEETDD